MWWRIVGWLASTGSAVGSGLRWPAAPAALLLLGCAPRAVDLNGPMGPPPPIPVAPRDGEVFSTARPTFRWKMLRGEDTTELTLCRNALCSNVLRRVQVEGSEWTPDADLPSGLLFYRLRGGVQGRMGLEPTLEVKFALEGKVALEGKRTAVIIAWDRKEFGEKLLGLAERGIDFFAESLAVPVPDITCRIHVYRTELGFEEAAMKYAPGSMGGHGRLGGFSGTWGSHVRGSGSEMDDAAVVAHELVHAFQNKSVRRHRDQPMWLREGVATLLAHRLLESSEGFGAAADSLRRDMRKRLRRQLDRGNLVSVEKLFDVDDDAVRKNPDPLYAESFMLLDLLDSSAQPERRERLRTWLREVAGMQGFLVASRIKRSFRDTFGPLGALDAELRKAAANRP